MALAILSPVVLLALIPVYAISRILYNLLLHPLRNVPGYLPARATSAWLTAMDMAGHRSRTIDQWHRQYGPVVRVGPNEVSFADPRLIKEIYGQATPYMKSSFYDTLNIGKPGNMFDMTNREMHQERRRLLSHAFSAGSISGTEPLVAESISKYLNWCSKFQGTPFDVFVWHRRLALDMVGSLFLGKGFGTLENDKPLSYLVDLDHHFLVSGLRWHTPWLLPLTSWLPIPAWKHFLGAQQRLIDCK